MPVHRILKERSSRGEDVFFYHVGYGFQYHMNVDREDSFYLKCVRYERGCPGRALYNAVDGFVHTVEHDHDPDMFYPDEMALRVSILERCSRLDYVPFRTIVDEEGARFCDEVRSRVTLERMRDSMRKKRMKNYPQPAPSTLEELSQALMDPANAVLTMTEDGSDNLYAGSVTAADGSHHVILSSHRQLQFMKHSQTLQSDGTFKVFPAGFDVNLGAAQVFVILTSWRNHILPLAWVLMERRTEEAYIAVLQLIHNLVGGPFAARTIITAFEDAEINAWRRFIPPDCKQQGCLYHSVDSMLRKAHDLQLTWWMRNDGEFKRIIRWICALPLLPHNYMIRGMALIMQSCREAGRQQFALLRPFFRYVLREWLPTRAKRKVTSVYGSANRTNNSCESHNRTLKKMLGVHGNMYEILGKIVKYEATVKRDIIALYNGRRVGRTRTLKALRNDQRLQNLAQDLRNPQGARNDAILNYLRLASHTFQRLFNERVG